MYKITSDFDLNRLGDLLLPLSSRVIHRDIRLLREMAGFVLMLKGYDSNTSF